MPAQHPKVARPSREAIGALTIWLNSWDLALNVADLADRTRNDYISDMFYFAAWLRRYRPKITKWAGVDRAAIQAYVLWLKAAGEPCPHQLTDGTPPASCTGYGVGTRRHHVVSLQQFFAWFCAEEDLPSPLDGVKFPAQQKLGASQVPIVPMEDLATLIKDAEKSRAFNDRRDAAALRLFSGSGVRLAELAGMDLGDVYTQRREIRVVGKGGRVRMVPYSGHSAVALDRYLRARAERPGASDEPASPLWLGHQRGRRMTANGIYLAVRRRAQRLGLTLHPHQLRHTFAHNWLDAGGSEGDLMAIAGWESPQMLRLYGASARAARARRAFDRIDVIGGI